MPDWLTFLVAVFGSGGFLSTLAWIGYRLHSDAVSAERGRADDARARAEAAEKRADEREKQIGILLGGFREPR